ncbi:MAG: tetratricopeptide repeat protein, partial [Candidatus Omnitrophota bacterium]
WDNEAPQALEEFKQAERLDKENYLIHLRLGMSYARLGRLTEAVEELKTAAEINPRDLQSHYLLALIYASMKNNPAANQEYEIILKTLIQEDPANLQGHLYLGQFYFSQGRYDEAMRYFQNALDIDGKNIDALFLLGSLLEKEGRREEAIQYFKQVLNVDAGHSPSLNSLGYLYAEQGKNLDEAVRLIRLALKAEPDNGAYVDSLGWAIFKKAIKENDTQLLKEAISLLEKANELLPDPEILEHLKEARAALEKSDESSK